MKYLTPALYTQYNDGVPGASSLSSVTLAQFINRAESAVDAYMGFDLKVGGFEPHIIGMVQRGFDFNTRRFRFPLPPVPIRNITRIRIKISQSGISGVGQYANVLPGEVVINEYEGYCELIALTITYSMAGVVWELGLNPPLLELDMETGFYFPILGETLYDSGDGKTFQSIRAFWASTYTQGTSLQPNVLPPIPPVVYVNGTVQGSGYTVNYQAGTVTFTGSQTGNTVSADYTATIPDLVAAATADQVTWLLLQRNLNQMGAGALEQVRSGTQFVRRARVDDAEEDQLCARARLKLASYKTIAIA